MTDIGSAWQNIAAEQQICKPVHCPIIYLMAPRRAAPARRSGLEKCEMPKTRKEEDSARLQE